MTVGFVILVNYLDVCSSDQEKNDIGGKQVAIFGVHGKKCDTKSIKHMRLRFKDGPNFHLKLVPK